MLQTHPETVSLGIGYIVAIIVIDEAAPVIHIGYLRTFLLDIPVGTAVQIIADKFHIPVQKVERPVHSCHP